jgi:hypothetical protein
MKSLTSQISKITNNVSKGNKGKLNIILKLNQSWSEIIDPEISKYCFVINLKFDKLQNKNTLYVKCQNSAVACYIDANKSNITEKICSYYGYRIISKIIATQ